MENENKKPDWKQWIPIYGIYRAGKDEVSIADPQNHLIRYLGSAVYHAVAMGGIIIGTAIGLEKILQ